MSLFQHALPVIIPIYNRLPLLKQTIESLAENTTGPFFPILINDNSDVSTTYYLNQLNKEGAIKLIKNSVTLGVGTCRNIGASIAPLEHPYIYFSDSDVYFTKDWDQQLLTAAQEFPQVAILSGQQHPYHHTNSSLKISQDPHHTLNLTHQQGAASMLIKRTIWNKIGPFDTTPPRSVGAEDVSICNKAKEQRYEVAAIDPAVIIHTGITRADGSKTAGAQHIMEQRRTYPHINFE